MQIPAAVRNVLIIFGIAALVVLIPGGGTGASVAIQAVSILFLGSIAWFASIMYRQHRIELDSLGGRPEHLRKVALEHHRGAAQPDRAMLCVEQRLRDDARVLESCATDRLQGRASVV